MAIVLKTDFVGEYDVAKTSYDNIDTFIEKYEKKYLKMLFGAKLYKLFIASLSGGTPQIPQLQKFIDLFDEFEEDNAKRELVVSEGIRKMLIQFIYFHYVRELETENSASGTVTNNTELGTNVRYQGNIITAYNEGVSNSRAIQWKLLENIEDYPEENIQIIEYISGI